MASGMGAGAHGGELVSAGEEAALPQPFGFLAKPVPEAMGWRDTGVHGVPSPRMLWVGQPLLGGMLLAGVGVGAISPSSSFQTTRSHPRL